MIRVIDNESNKYRDFYLNAHNLDLAKELCYEFIKDTWKVEDVYEVAWADGKGLVRVHS
jgi:hypothetical protein